MAKLPHNPLKSYRNKETSQGFLIFMCYFTF
nr:MAG TPA: hypothetical protein [Caudoviricetes sp.]